MPGTAQDAFFIRLEEGRVVRIGKHSVQRSIIESNVDKAVMRLRRGESIYLLAFGDNLARVKQAIEVQS